MYPQGRCGSPRTFRVPSARALTPMSSTLSFALMHMLPYARDGVRTHATGVQRGDGSWNQHGYHPGGAVGGAPVGARPQAQGGQQGGANYPSAQGFNGPPAHNQAGPAGQAGDWGAWQQGNQVGTSLEGSLFQHKRILLCVC
jgi:hypothetical protein